MFFSLWSLFILFFMSFMFFMVNKGVPGSTGSIIFKVDLYH